MPYQEVTEAINLGIEEERREVKIGTTLSPIIAWSCQDMPGLNTDIVVHHLPLKEECAPIKQKLRRAKPKMLLKIKE